MSPRSGVGLVGCFAATVVVAAALGAGVLLALSPFWLIPLPLIAARAARRPTDLFAPVWLFSGLLFFTYLLVPALELGGVEPFMSLPGFLRLSTTDYWFAMLLGGLGFAAFCAGYALPGRSREPAAGGEGRGAAGTDTARRVQATGVLLLVFGLLSLETSLVLVEAWSYSPREILTGALRGPSLEAGPGRGYLNVGFTALGFAGPCLCLALALRARERPALRRWVVPAMVAAGGGALVVFGAVLGSRQLAMATLVELAVVYHFAHRRISPVVLGGFAVALGLLGIQFIALRNTGALALSPVTAAGFASKTFDGFNFLVATLARTGFGDLAWGRTLIEDLSLTYLPRGLFPDKPTVFGIVAAQDAVVPGLSRTAASGTFPPGILSEGYLNFGVAGVLLLPLALGAGLRVLYDRAAVRRTPIAVLLLGWALGNAVGPLRGLGPVLPALAISVVLLLPLVLPLPRRRPRRPLATTAAVGLVLLAAVPLVVSPVVPRESIVRAEAKSDVIGRPVPPLGLGTEPELLLVWASWCEGCPRQLAELAELKSAQDLRISSVAYQDDPAAAARALDRAGASWPNVLDDGRRVRSLGVDRLPALFVVGPRGRIVCYLDTLQDSAELRRILATARRTGACE